MRFYILYFILIFFSISIHAQVDTKKKSVAIPTIESKKDSADITPLTPSKPIKNTTFGMNNPKVSPNLELPAKEFSMFPKEKFGNPGELYADQLKKHEDNIKKEEGLGTLGSKIDVFFGDHRTKSKYIQVMYRDYGLEDGDLIRVSVNDEIIEYRVALVNAFQGFKIDLIEGLNTIEFLALTEGYALPNTAHFRILDDQKKLIATNLWALSIDVKGTINIIKE
jgi:hypothetical protein